MTKCLPLLLIIDVAPNNATAHKYHTTFVEESLICNWLYKAYIMRNCYFWENGGEKVNGAMRRGWTRVASRRSPLKVFSIWSKQIVGVPVRPTVGHRFFLHASARAPLCQAKKSRRSVKLLHRRANFEYRGRNGFYSEIEMNLHYHFILLTSLIQQIFVTC